MVVAPVRCQKFGSHIVPVLGDHDKETFTIIFNHFQSVSIIFNLFQTFSIILKQFQ